jgi:hypothetical protein
MRSNAEEVAREGISYRAVGVIDGVLGAHRIPLEFGLGHALGDQGPFSGMTVYQN